MLSYIPKRTQNRQINNWTWVFIAELFIRDLKWKSSTWPSAKEWINKIRYSLTRKCYMAIKRNEVLIHAIMWINFENTMLSKRSQTQRATYCMILYIYISMSRIGKSTWIYFLNRLVVARNWVGEDGEWMLTGIGFYFGVMKMFWN